MYGDAIMPMPKTYKQGARGSSPLSPTSIFKASGHLRTPRETLRYGNFTVTQKRSILASVMRKPSYFLFGARLTLFPFIIASTRVGRKVLRRSATEKHKPLGFFFSGSGFWYNLSGKDSVSPLGFQERSWTGGAIRRNPGRPGYEA